MYESRAIDSIFPYYKGQLWLARAKPGIPVIAFENIFMAQYCITNFRFQRIDWREVSAAEVRGDKPPFYNLRRRAPPPPYTLNKINDELLRALFVQLFEWGPYFAYIDVSLIE